MAHAETKFTTGLHATGVGLCLCARHEFVWPCGVGDLQKGERYVYLEVQVTHTYVLLVTVIWTTYFFPPLFRFCLFPSSFPMTLLVNGNSIYLQE